MESNKKMIIILVTIIIVVIMIIGILILLISNRKNNNIGDAAGETHIESSETKKIIENVSVRRDWYIAKTCINTFYTYYSNIYNLEQDVKIVDDDAIASNQKLKQKYIDKVYNMLDDEYTEYSNITTSNLENKLNKIGKATPDITKLYVYKKDDNMSIFFIKGNLLDTTSISSKEFSIILKVDMLNRTFSIFMDDYVKDKFNNIELGQQINEDLLGKTPENKDDNIFIYENVTDETYIRDVFTSIKKNLICNRKAIYDRLDEEYRKSKFSNEEEFEEYIKNNLKDITTMTLAKYQKNQYEDYTEYVCIDNSENYYIIKVDNPSDYTIMLDIYTLNIDAFKEKYDKANNFNKAGLNFEKIKQALAKKDYKYIYNKLNQEFKQNNFAQYQKFESYMKETLASRNIFEYINVDDRQTVYVATIESSDSNNKSESIKKITIIEQLNDNYDFEISLSIE